jgi:hypothetical protein
VKATEPPTRADVKEKLHNLLARRLSREEVSSWALRWVAMDDPNVDDQLVWRALTRMGGADARAGSDEYLYFDADFQAWLDEFEAPIGEA